MRVIIVEDNPIELQCLKEILALENDVQIIGTATDGIEAKKIINRLKPDVVFLDISLPGVNGMELAKMIPDEVFIVFVTANSHLAIGAFEVGSIDYILKPVEPERLNSTLRRIKKLIPQKVMCPAKLSINIRGTILTLDINKILFIEKNPTIKKVTIHYQDKEFIISGTLGKLEERLKIHGFVRSHKSFILNINKIEKMIPWGDKSYLAKLYDSKKEVLVSRSYAPIVKDLIHY